MRILFVHPVTDMSIGDVARGYRAALVKQGHTISDYSMKARFSYHRKAIPPEFAEMALVAKHASETILCEAMYCNADLVIIISGLNTHPIAMWLLSRVSIPVAVILTESPYDDESQKQWVDLACQDADNPTVFTNDRYSAERFGWNFLAPSFDPTVHFPVEPDPGLACDVLMVGTGWLDRQKLIGQVDWSGIDLKLYGIWPDITADSPLYKFYRMGVVDNKQVAAMYCSAKINLNIHRTSLVAKTPGPRLYEVAACGAFQLSNPREDLTATFGEYVPTFTMAKELEHMVRYYLERPGERVRLAAGALDRVCSEDFDSRASALMAALETQVTENVGT